MSLYLGIDFGTSGARAIIIDEAEIIQWQKNELFLLTKVKSLAQMWQDALFALLVAIPLEMRKKIQAIAINGTSATVILCDKFGHPIDEPILYNDARGKVVKDEIKSIAPFNHTVISATSSLSKLFWWQKQNLLSQASYFLHQADWLAFLLHGKLGISDYHNALKLGYDVETLSYPDWLKELSCFSLLPEIFSPGYPLDTITHNIAHQFSLPSSCVVCTGTTDSIAAFLASGAKYPGEAVTSLGSTLVLKLLSQTRIENAKFGIYSHRLGNLWLTGGASNTGGAVLQHFFTNTELETHSQKIDATQESPLEYYPLLSLGDRFPINDPSLPPKLEPRPKNPVEFLHGLLESMARLEALGYQKLQELGATHLTKVYTAGGGAKNKTWCKIRQRHLQVPVFSSLQTEAAYGTAILAKGSDPI
ncbi:carbohydrate kinase [Aphanothece hegewaldii CCALA 016]|uniref:D-ribulose kinase n=1 Tax=Aphanothece hegewaldii CCALA 016 TaxID=2107694 RepID=A0A2T1LUL6_9CHRO|nr:FGGY-family carbohydrate kinase [Aphanothece hegewaldii]PSF35260.1 carbohydrate kinase [Aphanothece hegewaldii CCALA 016]